jgi:hypothetical protein
VATHPTVDISLDRLHRAGWSVGEIATAARWLVTGTNGENALDTRRVKQAQAWPSAALHTAAWPGIVGRLFDGGKSLLRCLQGGTVTR